jgi:hypothetical protein
VRFSFALTQVHETIKHCCDFPLEQVRKLLHSGAVFVDFAAGTAYAIARWVTNRRNQ